MALEVEAVGPGLGENVGEVLALLEEGPEFDGGTARGEDALELALLLGNDLEDEAPSAGDDVFLNLLFQETGPVADGDDAGQARVDAEVGQLAALEVDDDLFRPLKSALDRKSVV